MIRLMEGLHLTATNKRHIGQLVASGRTSGATGQLAYTLEPVAGDPAQWRYLISKSERDDSGRPAPRYMRGIVQVTA